MRVAVDPARCFLHPNLSVADAPLGLMPPTENVSLLNPRVLVEVYPPATEAADRGEKFHRHLALPSLREYLLFN